ncbi:MAG: hypothetical protein CME88_03905 [Hirschia sp.]|nr:hypothetical protein [Hirschia sp.]MBF17502.1 hypothetical protein [Hirschia sp.]
MTRHGLLALVVLAFAAPMAIAQESGLVFTQPYWTQKPVIEAQGRSQVELAPNRATFSVSFVETDKQADDAMSLAVEKARIAYDAIKAVAGDKALVSTSVNVEAYYEQYRDKDGDYYENERPDKVKGYEATALLNVQVKDVAVAGTARAAALALGPQSSDTLNVYLEPTAEVMRLAFESAVEDGAARAKASAKAAGMTLGSLLVLQEGSGPCLGSWSTSAGMDNRYYSAAAPAPMAEMMRDSVVVTGSKRDGSTVTITQADIDALNLPSDLPPQTMSASVCMVYAVGE